MGRKVGHPIDQWEVFGAWDFVTNVNTQLN